MEVSYPKLPRDKWKGIKIKEKDILEIHYLYSLGVTQSEIASKFGVCSATIYRYLSDEYKTRQNQAKLKAEKRLRKNPEYRKKRNLQRTESKRRKRELLPEFRKWENQEFRSRYKKNKLQS